MIYDQKSLERDWSLIEVQLRTQTVTEEDVLQTLKTGFLQTPTGKRLAPLFVDAILRSIKPLDGLTPKQLREIVVVICDLPPHQWADAFGENVNFPRGRNGEGVHGFIQDQLTQSRMLREQQIADGELLDNDTWKAVRDLTTQARQYVRKSAEGPLNIHLRQLEDHVHVRPSPKHAQMLVALYVAALDNPDPGQRPRWPGRFADTAHALHARLQAIEINDNRPELTEVVHSTLSKIATPMTAALTKLGSMSFKDVGDELQSAVSTVLTKAGCYFIFGADFKHVSEQKADNTPADSELLLKLQEIEKASSFHDEVITTGPRYTGGFWGKLLYVANGLDTVGLLGIAEKIRPHLPAAPASPVDVLPSPVEAEADAQPPAEAVPERNVGQWLDAVADLEQEVNDFIASHSRSSATGTREDISDDPKPSASSLPTSSAMDGLDFEQIAQAISDFSSRIDYALTFPSASANELQELLQKLEETSDALEELAQAESIGPMQVTPDSWWAPIAQQLNSYLFRITTALATYSLGAASSALQLIRDNPGASVTTAFVAVSALYNEYRQTLQDPTAPGTALPATESPALHQERLENDIEQILGKPVAAGEPGLFQTILKRMYQSTEHDLLDDEQLIQDVAYELQRPSPQDPAKPTLS
ncbi:hypothetical protein CES87_29920 [Pseudomonas sp. ERMR1:02]|nr:hypothetical protein CES87_29920 [Pseudomonas sp. ERMR1:02]